MDQGNGDGFAGSEAALHEEACQAVGLDDFGDRSYLEGLRILLDSLDHEAKLSGMGRAIFRAQIVQILKTRLVVNQRLAKDPAVLENEIRRPIIITGLVRTGSTALHYLMGQDPSLQKLEYWLSAEPQPRPPRDEWEGHRDFESARRELEFLYKATPALMAVHEMRADWPEECRHILAQNFTDDRFEVSATIPSYCAWYHTVCHRETYQRHKQLIQLIGSTDPKRRWLLKYPVHLRQLPVLFELYPDACIVQTHRDPHTVMASYTSFVSKVRALHEESVDLPGLAREQLESWGKAADAGIAFRKAHGSAQFYDLHFPDFMSDPVGSVKRIYEHFDQELPAASEQRLQAWQDAHPQGKHGPHAYRKQDLGISESEIRDRFADYLEYHNMQA